MIDTTKVTLVTPDDSALIRFEVWSDHAAALQRLTKALGASLPEVGKSKDAKTLRLIWLEPNTWMVRSPAAAELVVLGKIETALGQDGAAAQISGALVRRRITGTGWRTLLTIGAMFDAESAAFGPGCYVATLIDHAPVRLDVISDTEVDAYTPPSYAPDLFAFWQHAAQRL